MTQDELKKQAAAAALEYVKQDSVVGVGTGSTVNFFIELLASKKGMIEGTVASSQETEKRLKELHIPVFDLNAVNNVSVYIDGADEATDNLYLIKGLGGALTREKIIATASKQFICIIDQSKKVDVLGTKSPIPVEVIPMARGLVARQIVKLGGDPIYRESYLTDNGNIILDVHNLHILDAVDMENKIKMITGVVDCGIFANRPADVLLVADDDKVTTIS